MTRPSGQSGLRACTTSSPRRPDGRASDRSGGRRCSCFSERGDRPRARSRPGGDQPVVRTRSTTAAAPRSLPSQRSGRPYRIRPNRSSPLRPRDARSGRTTRSLSGGPNDARFRPRLRASAWCTSPLSTFVHSGRPALDRADARNDTEAAVTNPRRLLDSNWDTPISAVVSDDVLPVKDQLIEPVSRVSRSGHRRPFSRILRYAGRRRREHHFP